MQFFTVKNKFLQNLKAIQAIYHIIKRDLKINRMHPELEELSTIQTYINTLFDSMPKMSFSHEQANNSQLLLLAIAYGRKIIELSDKFTSLYRNDHLTNRKDIEAKIIKIYKAIHPSSIDCSLEDMLDTVFQKFCQEREKHVQSFEGRMSNTHSQYNLNSEYKLSQAYPLLNQHIEQSKRQSKYNHQKDEENQFSIQRRRIHQNTGEKMLKSRISSENHPKEEVKRKKSIKSKPIKKNQDDFSMKNVLLLKSFFQEEQDAIRQIYSKLKSFFMVQKFNINLENMHFTKIQKDTQQDNIIDFVRVNSQNMVQNLKKFNNCIDVICSNSEKNRKNEGVAQGKFNLYFEEINRRQEVFSFSVSKLLQKVCALKDMFFDGNLKNRQIEKALNNIEQLGEKFYEVYPSTQILNDLQVEKLAMQIEQLGLKNQGTQVSIGKTEQSIHKQIAESKRSLVEFYKGNTRINQMIERFEKSIKFKKQIECKEIEKIFQFIKEITFKKVKYLPSSSVSQINAFQNNLKQIMDQNEKNEKDLHDEYQKKVRKLEKHLNEFQKNNKELSLQLQKQIQSRDIQKKKYQKKLESEKEDNKILTSQKRHLEVNLGEMNSELQRLRQAIKNEKEQFDEAQKGIFNQNLNLIKSIEEREQEKQQLFKKLNSQLNKISEERNIYHQKIIMLEAKEEELIQQSGKLKYELEAMISENNSLKSQVQDLTDIYETKIKELQQMIENIKDLQKQLQIQQIQNEELSQNLKINQERIKNLSEQISTSKLTIEKLQASIEQKNKEIQKYKQIGLLNDSDINVLKEEMEKVKEAYYQADDQVEQSRKYITELQIDKQNILKQNIILKKKVDEQEDRLQKNSFQYGRADQQIREFQDEVNIKVKHCHQLQLNLEGLKRENSKLKQEIYELRQSLSKSESESRLARQQLQKKLEQDNLENGKKKLQLEALKVELRRKNEQVEKQKQNYEEKIDVLENKNREMAQFITQKQLLAKITNHHQSN